MRRKELFMRAGAVALSASLAMSSPIAVLADESVIILESSVAEGVKDSEGDNGVDITPEEDGSSAEKAEDSDVEDITSAPDEVVEDSTVEDATPIPDESPKEQTDTSTDDEETMDDADNTLVSSPSDAEEKEDEVLDNDIEVKQFTITVVDHFGDTTEERETTTLDKDSEYSYSALLDKEGWSVVGNTTYDGVLSKDVTLDFYYELVEKPLSAVKPVEPIVTVTFDFGGDAVAVDPSKITMQYYNPSQFLIKFDKELIDGIEVEENRFRGKYSYGGKKWFFDKEYITKNGIETSDSYDDIFEYGKVINVSDTFDMVFYFTELQTTVAESVSIDKDFGCYVSEEESLGTFKNIHLSVDDTQYDLSADTPTDIKFEDGSTVKVVIGEDADIWSGTCTVDSGKPQFEVNKSSYYCSLGVEAAGVRIFNDFVYGSLGSGSAGGSGGGTSWYYKQTYYDLTAKTVDNEPITGVSITDTNVQWFEGLSHGEAGLLKALTSGEMVNGVHRVEDGLYFSYYENEYGEPVGTILSLTNSNGFTNMSVPASGGSSYLDGIERARPSTESGTIRAHDDKVYVGDGNVELSEAVLTVNDIGYPDIAGEYAPKNSDAMLGSYYRLGYTSITEPFKTLAVKDSFGNEIGTVTLDTVSAESNVPLNINSSAAVTVPRYEKSYAEPNREVNVDTKGIIEFDSKKYKPLASKDADSNVSEASSVKIDVESGKSYAAYFYYGEGEGVPTEPPTDPTEPPTEPLR